MGEFARVICGNSLVCFTVFLFWKTCAESQAIVLCGTWQTPRTDSVMCVVRLSAGRRQTSAEKGAQLEDRRMRRNSWRRRCPVDGYVQVLLTYELLQHTVVPFFHRCVFNDTSKQGLIEGGRSQLWTLASHFPPAYKPFIFILFAGTCIISYILYW